MSDRLRVALVGAGAVAARCHLPAIRAVPEVRPTLVVDADAERARRFAERYCFPRWSADHADVIGCADLAIVALPNWLHATVSSDLLSSGVHVLCEKPMARDVEECGAMIASAEKGGALLAIGHNRRFRPHVALTHRLVTQRLIGEIVRVEAAEGSREDWPRSRFYFDPALAGGGALMDVGIHAIDLIRWMVADFGELTYAGVGVRDGIEAEADLRFKLVGGAEGRLVVSRERDLSQELILVGTEGSLTMGLWSPGLRIRGGKGKAFQRLAHLDLAVARRAGDASFGDQLLNLVHAIQGRGSVLVDGREGMASVQVVRRAYGGPVPAASTRVMTG